MRKRGTQRQSGSSMRVCLPLTVCDMISCDGLLTDRLRARRLALLLWLHRLLLLLRLLHRLLLLLRRVEHSEQLSQAMSLNRLSGLSGLSRLSRLSRLSWLSRLSRLGGLSRLSRLCRLRRLRWLSWLRGLGWLRLALDDRLSRGNRGYLAATCQLTLHALQSCSNKTHGRGDESQRSALFVVPLSALLICCL